LRALKKEERKMKKLTIAGIILMLSVTLLLPVAGCNGETEETGPATPENNRWLDMLKVLPENETTLKAAFFSGPPFTSAEIVNTEHFLGFKIPFFGNSPSDYSDELWKATVGFTASDVDYSIYSGSPPMDYYEAVYGRFNREEIDNAARTGPGNEGVEIVPYAGQEFYSWGGDRDVNISKRSGIRPLGRGYRLALLDDFVFWEMTTAQMEDMIDAYEGNIPSLADNTDYQLLAEKLAEYNTSSAFFSGESHSLSHYYEVNPREKLEAMENDYMERLFQGLDYEPLLKPFRAMATGAGQDENGYYMVIVLANEDESTAEENAALLEQRIKHVKLAFPNQNDTSTYWEDAITSMEIGNDGRLTTAKLYGNMYNRWKFFQIQGMWPFEPLLVHE
jgi:hypothetical protein